MTPLSPFFLASLLNASARWQTRMLLIYTSHVYSRTIHRRKKTKLWAWILIRVGSTMPLPHDQVEGQYNDNSFCNHDATKPNITASPYNRSDRSKTFQDQPILGCRGAIKQSLIIGNSSTMVTGFLRHSANYVIQYMVNLRLITFWKK